MLAPPDVGGGLLKPRTPRGLFGERDLNTIFTAHLLTRAVRSIEEPRICEIGAGGGRTAYWSHRLGLRDLTLVDLPLVNVFEAITCSRCLPEDRVTLYGEPVPSTTQGVRILPAGALASAGVGRFDLVLNQDSFPEMAPATVREYLTRIRALARELLSINNESKPSYGANLARRATGAASRSRHASVPEEIARVGGFELRDRSRYWLRRGYLAEIYRVAS